MCWIPTSSACFFIICPHFSRQWSMQSNHGDWYILIFYLVTVVCWIVDPLPHIGLVLNRDGPNGGFGCRSGGHVKFHIYIADKTGRHFPVRAKLQVTEEAVRMPRSCKKRANRHESCIRWIKKDIEEEATSQNCEIPRICLGELVCSKWQYLTCFNTTRVSRGINQNKLQKGMSLTLVCF